jgi:hypothetical protein
VRLEKPAVPRFYLIVIPLLIASLVLLRFATFPGLLVLAPPMSKLIGRADIDPSEGVGGSTQCAETSGGALPTPVAILPAWIAATSC